MCGISWPKDPVYKICPQCDEKTSYIKDAPDIDEPDAQAALIAQVKRKKEAADKHSLEQTFEQYYKDWCKRKGKVYKEDKR